MARVAMEAISGRMTIQEITADHGIHPIQVSQWKRYLLDVASKLFTRGKRSKDKDEGQAKEAELFQQIRRLQMEYEWLRSQSLSCSDARELCKLVDHVYPELSIRRQCALLGLPPSMLHYQPTPMRESTLQVMARNHDLDLEDPCSGSRRMVGYLARHGIPISRDRMCNLLQRIGLEAIDQIPRTTAPGDPATWFPSLVDLSMVTAEDQMWATAIIYIPRHMLSWKLSNSLDTEFFLNALLMVLEGSRRSEIFHSNQGC